MATVTKKKRTVSAAQREKWAAEKKAQAEKLQGELAAKVEALTASGAWIEYLNFIQSFHTYSFNNAMLIWAQKPDATLVAGFRQWQAKGRQVRKGERSIKIRGFAKKWVDDETQPDGRRQITVYPFWSVFDISQTDAIDGAELPAHPARRLEGDDVLGIYAAASDFITARGWTVERDEIDGETNGYTTLDGTFRIVVDSRLSDAQAAKTLLHEIGHALNHADEKGKPVDGIPREVAELEAESVAYVVAGVLGMDTSAYTVGYLASWSGGSGEMVAATAERVLAASRDVLAVLDPAPEPEAEPED